MPAKKENAKRNRSGKLKSLSLIDRAKAHVPAKKKQTFFDRLPDSAKKELLALRAEFNAGKLPNLQPHVFYRDVVQPEYGLTVTHNTFVRWMHNE